MKHFLKGVMQWKTSACLMFTAAVIFYLIFSMIYGTWEVPVMMLWAAACQRGGVADPGHMLLRMGDQKNALYTAQHPVCCAVPAAADAGGMEIQLVPDGGNRRMGYVYRHVLPDFYYHDRRL